jgi:hypothetical protein
MFNFKKYQRAQSALLVAFATMADLVSESIKAGFQLVKSASRGTIIHESKAGNAQLIFRKEGEPALFVRISDNALDAITAGAKPASLPVYDVTLFEDNDPTKPEIGNMLVIGIEGGENPDWVPADAKDMENLFKVIPKVTA